MTTITPCLLLLVLLPATLDGSESADASKSRAKREDRFLQIVTVLEAPYTYRDEQTGELYGFIPDILDHLTEQLGSYDYNVTVSNEGYGQMENGAWNGMIGHLTRREYDMAAAPITITSQRHRVVDFIQPFSHVGVTVAIQKPSAKSSDSHAWHFDFNVFKPLAAECWLTITAVMVVVWLFFWLMNIFNPYEYGDRFKRNMASEDQASLFNLSGSLWFTFTTLQWQGYDRSPRSVASKMMGCFWMIFVTLTIVTYISSFLNHMFWASLAHKARISNESPIRDLVDLVNHKDGYTYGCVRDSSTYQYIAQSREEVFHKMYDYWNSEEGKNALVGSTEEAVEKMRNEKYAFIGETMIIRHEASKADKCDLMDTGITFARRSYGFALPLQSEIKGDLDLMILHMIEKGTIDALEEKWWNEHRCHGEQQKEKEQSSLYLDKPQPVTMHMFWSPIVLIVVGIVLSCIVGLAEILWYKYRGRYDAAHRQRGQQLTNDDEGHI